MWCSRSRLLLELLGGGRAAPWLAGEWVCLVCVSCECRQGWKPAAVHVAWLSVWPVGGLSGTAEGRVCVFCVTRDY